ncbi:MAG: hypothetical protein COS85_01895 [Armatimonadetes bacterium CG07_land_8_20_14_0_80_59_28]|nr:MAG: hypothetical protein COS85_01895 [Armatimonadetes bacterium CG07_land_8_20_14_0_80_59_28]
MDNTGVNSRSEKSAVLIVSGNVNHNGFITGWRLAGEWPALAPYDATIPFPQPNGESTVAPPKVTVTVSLRISVRGEAK